ncbi:roadblock/LC7 domain-containing protein [Acinetobacter sp. B51(2017)]|uniref:roadblock/LC7 domain-containing protein n=1 Tax=Acinetobacter sp. B51(2017) TaxID=2060938 RepID=UPI000F09031D|nr:roadblock/LC7 domain-containing protein [Acinetobacter sp. B51(2017)]
MLLQRSAPDALINLAHESIHEVLREVNGVEYIMLCSTDGFELTSVHRKNINNSGKLAAVSSSILAMVQAFLGEINLNGCQSMTLDAENGKALISAVPSHNHPMLVVVISAKDVMLGHLLLAVKRATEQIAEADQNYTQ